MKILEDIILSFDIYKRLTESAAYPLVAYGVINYISARELHEYLTESKLKVSLSSVQNWRRNAATTLGLNPSGKGRQSFAVQKTQREEWHQKYGYPSIRQLMDGWNIRTSTPPIVGDFGGESMRQTPANSSTESPVGSTHSKTIFDTITPSKREANVDDKSTHLGSKKRLMEEIEFSDEEVNLDKFKASSTKRNK